jgi:hypothetical protein
MPFLFDRLLCATGPFGLGVEFKSDERAVGTWTIELGARGDDAAHPARANANLFVCASATSDARATGAFLVIRQWRVNASDKEQLERLYEMLSIAAIERLDSLLGGVANRAGESRLCVIYLMDGRRFDRRNFSLDRLQIRLLEDLEGALSLAEVDLRVAHGRGTGTPPHAVFASTRPAPMQANDSALGSGDGRASPSPAAHNLPVGEVFVRETLSPENVRWNRRASDRPNRDATTSRRDPIPVPAGARAPGPKAIA